MKKLNLCLSVLLLIGMVKVCDHEANVQTREEQIGEAYNATLAAVAVIEEHLAYLDVIYTTSAQYNIPPEITLAIMKVESGFDPDAKNGRCYGIMQISDVHCHGFGVETEDLLDLRKNTAIGLSLFSGLEKDSETMTEALGRYKMGTAGWRKSGQTVTNYAEKVMSIVKGLQEGRVYHDQD